MQTMLKHSFEASSDDIQLLSLMVTKKLKGDYGDPLPVSIEYELGDDPQRWEDRRQLNVMLTMTRGLTLRHQTVWWSDGSRDMEFIESAAEELDERISRFIDTQDDIRAMIAEVRAATKREIAKANRRGLAYRFVDIDLVASEHNYPSRVCPRISIERLSHSLRPEIASFEADCAYEVKYYFEMNREEQEKRVASRARLAEKGATGKIDAVVANALKSAGFDLPEVIDRLRQSDSWIVDIITEDQHFPLYWKNGAVYAHIRLEDGVSWNEGRLTFREAPKALTKRLVGRDLASVFQHPLLPDGLAIQYADGSKGGYGVLSCTPSFFHFDLASGHIW